MTLRVSKNEEDELVAVTSESLKTGDIIQPVAGKFVENITSTNEQFVRLTSDGRMFELDPCSPVFFAKEDDEFPSCILWQLDEIDQYDYPDYLPGMYLKAMRDMDEMEVITVQFPHTVATPGSEETLPRTPTPPPPVVVETTYPYTRRSTVNLQWRVVENEDDEWSPLNQPYDDNEPAGPTMSRSNKKPLLSELLEYRLPADVMGSVLRVLARAEPTPTDAPQLENKWPYDTGKRIDMSVFLANLTAVPAENEWVLPNIIPKFLLPDRTGIPTIQKKKLTTKQMACIVLAVHHVSGDHAVVFDTEAPHVIELKDTPSWVPGANKTLTVSWQMTSTVSLAPEDLMAGLSLEHTSCLTMFQNRKLLVKNAQKTVKNLAKRYGFTNVPAEAENQMQWALAKLPSTRARVDVYLYSSFGEHIPSALEKILTSGVMQTLFIEDVVAFEYRKKQIFAVRYGLYRSKLVLLEMNTSMPAHLHAMFLRTAMEQLEELHGEFNMDLSVSLDVSVERTDALAVAFSSLENIDVQFTSLSIRK